MTAAKMLAIATSPAIDRIALAREPIREGVVRTDDFLETPGGKGTHVAMVGQSLGANVTLVAPAGGTPGRVLEDLLAAEGVPSELVPVSSATRGTYTLVDPDRGDLFEIHEPPPPLTADDTEAVLECVRRVVRGARVAVIAGGLPLEVGPNFHANLVRAARQEGATCLVDTSSPTALEGALGAGADIAIPNLAEANAATGSALSADAPLSDFVRLAADLLTAGGTAIVLTLGARGSVVVTRERKAWRVGAPVVGRAVNAVGCGDAFAAGLAVGLIEERHIPDAVALGAAAAADKLTRLHSGRVDGAAVRRIIDQVEVEPVH